jgi:hypothetical protein
MVTLVVARFEENEVAAGHQNEDMAGHLLGVDHIRHSLVKAFLLMIAEDQNRRRFVGAEEDHPNLVMA